MTLRGGCRKVVTGLLRANRGSGSPRPSNPQEIGALENDLGKVHTLRKGILGYGYAAVMKNAGARRSNEGIDERKKKK